MTLAEKEQREYAWNYFKLHAGQRMMTFNFFVIVAALLTKGVADCINQQEANHSFVGIILSIALIAVTFASWKLDQRVRYLLKHAEAALMRSEEEWGPFALFTLEERNTKSIEGHWLKPQTWHMTYPKCFGVFYWVFLLIGAVGFVFSITLLFSRG